MEHRGDYPQIVSAFHAQIQVIFQQNVLMKASDFTRTYLTRSVLV